MSDNSIHNDGIYDIDSSYADMPVVKENDTVFIILLFLLMML